MKKQATRCKRKALCILCLVLLLPLATPLMTTTPSWCAFSGNYKTMTDALEKRIKELKDNLLPSIVQYEVLTDTDAAKLDDCCFIVITAQQLINTFNRLLKYIGKNTTNYHIIINITDWLTTIRNETVCASQCKKQKPRIVTGCTSGLFAYSEAYVSHYSSIFDRCEEQHPKDSSFPRHPNTSLKLNSCLVVLHGDSAADSVAAVVCSRYLPAPSRPQPFTSSAAPRRTTMTNELGSASEVAATLVNTLKGDKIGGTAVDKKTPLANPDHRQDNVSQAASSHVGPTTEAQSKVSSAVLPPMTSSMANGITSKHDGGDQAKTNNTVPIFDVFIALFVGLIVVTLCIFLIHWLKNWRMAHRVYRAPGVDPNNSDCSLDDPHYEL